MRLPYLINKFFMSPARRAWVAEKTFPPGHPEREKALAACDEEYAECSKQEADFSTAFNKRLGSLRARSLRQAKDIVDAMCRAMGAKTIKSVRLVEPGIEHAEAYLKGFDIYVRLPVSIWVLAHETAHHIHLGRFWGPFQKPHGKVFCKIERELFDYLLSPEADQQLDAIETRNLHLQSIYWTGKFRTFSSQET